MKILILASEPVSAPDVRDAVGEDVSDAEVMVVPPALTHSPLRFWASDVDEAIEHAQSTQRQTVKRLREEGIPAQGDSGESAPLQALEDNLALFAADRIVIFSHPEGERDYREDELEEAERRFGIPVTHRRLSRSAR